MATKRENGVDFPAEAYAYTPDLAKPSEWKLRMWEDLQKKTTMAQLGRACAALSSGGFRGNQVEIPEADIVSVKRKIRGEYRRLGVKSEDMPKAVFSAELAEEMEEFAGPTVSGLTYSDKETILAAALGVSKYNVKDFSDTEVFYSYTDPVSGGTGLYRRTYSIADGNKVTLGAPSQVISRTIYEPVVVVSAFALDVEPTFAGKTVIRTGKVFECGDYPDKDFSLTEAEADVAIAKFKPVQNDLEHKNTILDGKLGVLQSVKRVGKDLFGSIAIPKWLSDAIGNAPVKTSLAWDSATKTIVGNGLVLNPRIADAQLVAAFNEASGLNKEGAMPKTKMSRKTWWENVVAFFSAGLPEGLEDLNPDNVEFSEEEPQQPKPDAKPAAAPTFSEPSPEQKRIAELEAELAGKAAAEFADQAIGQNRAFPAERESLIALFMQARKDDAAGLVCFAADGKTPTTRVAALQASIDARPAHKLTSEELAGIDTSKLVVLGTTDFGDDNPETPTATGKKISEARLGRLAQFSGIKEGK